MSDASGRAKTGAPLRVERPVLRPDGDKRTNEANGANDPDVGCLPIRWRLMRRVRERIDKIKRNALVGRDGVLAEKRELTLPSDCFLRLFLLRLSLDTHTDRARRQLIGYA